MRKGLRFRTKLIVAMMGSALTAAALLIVITERRFTSQETKKFSERFARQVEYLSSTRKERAETILRLSQDLASSNTIVSALRNHTQPAAGFPWKDLAERGRQIPQRPYPGVDLGQGPEFGGLRSLNPNPSTFMAVMDLDGKLRNLSAGGPAQRSKHKGALEPGQEVRDLLEHLDERAAQQIGYIALEPPDGPAFAQEVAFTPVKDPKNGKAVGAFIMGLSAITPAERLLERLGESSDDQGVADSGIYLDGEIYPAGAASPHLDELAAAVRRALSGKKNKPGSSPSTEGQFTVRLGGQPWSVHFSVLNPDSTLPKAYQIATFPLARLEEELTAMRQDEAVVSLFALTLTTGLALVLSRSLSGPVRSLSKAAKAIGDGDFEVRVPVRTRDELGDLADSFNRMAEELEQKDHYRELLGKVSDKAVAQAMISGTLDLELGGEARRATILFCDIRGFTALSEEMPPTEIITILNRHMTAMTEVTRENHGVVDKFIGDAIMCVFGCLKSYGNDPAHAAQCALRMIEEREQLNTTSPLRLEIGIGMATGEVVAGCMGSIDRLNYTVLGTKVNLAARLASQAGAGEVIIDETTLAALGPEFRAEPLGEIAIRGFSTPQIAYRLEAASTRTERVEPVPIG